MVGKQIQPLWKKKCNELMPFTLVRVKSGQYMQEKWGHRYPLLGEAFATSLAVLLLFIMCIKTPSTVVP